MNYLIQQFIDLKKKIGNSFDLLRDDLHGIRDALQEKSGATSDPNAANHANKSPDPLSVVVVDGIETRKSASDHKEDGKYQDRNLFWQKLTFWAVFVYAGITAWQACLTRRIVNISQETYAATVRPYIGIEKIKTSHIWVNSEGVRIEEPTQTKNTVEMDVEIIVRNFGNVPGEDFVSTYKLFSDGKEIPIAVLLSSPHIRSFPPNLSLSSFTFFSQITSPSCEGKKYWELTFTPAIKARSKAAKESNI